MILPWICTDFSTKETLARILIDEPNAVFHNTLYKPVVSPIINYLLRSVSGIGYAVYGLALIYQHHQEKMDPSNQQKYAFTWLYLFVFFQVLLFLICLINSLIAYTDTIEGLIYRYDSLYYISAGMVVTIQPSILLIFLLCYTVSPKKITQLHPLYDQLLWVKQQVSYLLPATAQCLIQVHRCLKLFLFGFYQFQFGL